MYYVTMGIKGSRLQKLIHYIITLGFIDQMALLCHHGYRYHRQNESVVMETGLPGNICGVAMETFIIIVKMYGVVTGTSIPGITCDVVMATTFKINIVTTNLRIYLVAVHVGP